MYPKRPRIDIKPDCPQLFVDDYLIDTMSEVRPVFHPPTKVPKQQAAAVRKKPAVPGDVFTAAELAYYTFPAMTSDYDGSMVRFQFTGDLAEGSRVSFDGIQPIPGLYDTRAPTPRPMHVRFRWPENKQQLEPGYGLQRSISLDGKNWEPWLLVAPRVQDGPGECHSIFWDYRKQCLVDTVRMGSNYPHGRTVGRMESYDFGLHWKPPVRTLTEDDDDPEDLQVYNACSGIYAGIYVSVVGLYHTNTGYCDPQLAVSRDGFNYLRYRQPLIPLGPEGGPESGMLWAQYPVLDGERLRFHYEATPRNHNEDGYPDSKNYGAAFLRKDGFVSLDAADHTGTVVTRPFRCPARDTYPQDGTVSMFLNADVRRGGELRVSILDMHGSPILSRERMYLNAENCDVITGDHVKTLVSWKRVSDMANLNIYAQVIRIRFDMINTSLYSFGIYEHHGTATQPLPRVQRLKKQEE